MLRIVRELQVEAAPEQALCARLRFELHTIITRDFVRGGRGEERRARDGERHESCPRGPGIGRATLRLLCDAWVDFLGGVSISLASVAHGKTRTLINSSHKGQWRS